MNELDTYLTLMASQTGRAVPRASRCHVHLAEQPFTIVGYHLAGDLGAPLALMYGTERDDPRIVVVPEPRNRGLRFASLNEFGAALLSHLAGFAATETVSTKRGCEELCLDAPQILVPNPATASWLYDIVARFTRSLPLDGEDPAPRNVVAAGKDLSFFASMRHIAGSSLTVAATEALTRHWVTGQLSGEDQNLEALLGWLDPAPHADGPTAALMRERRPPAGPISDPHWDAGELAALIGEWHAAGDAAPAQLRARENTRAALVGQLRWGWDGCWDALAQLRRLPVAEQVEKRWRSDRREWTRHLARVEAGRAWFRNVPTPLQSARSLRKGEDSIAELDVQMAFDDPLVMAGLAAAGQALAGHVIAVDARHTEPGPSRAVCRPLVDVMPSIHFLQPPGTRVSLVDNPAVHGVVDGRLADGTVRVMITGGANRAGTIGRLPVAGERVVFGPHHEFFPSPELPTDVPWTHLLPAQG